jgi:two-component system, OmpR family, sensor kinase
MLNSVRIRLTLWYTGAMTVVLVVLAIATYVVLKQNVIRRSDAAAIELADSFLATVNAELSNLPKCKGIEGPVSAAIAEHSFQDVIFVVLDDHGQLIEMSQNRQDSEHREAFNWEELDHSLVTATPNSKPFHFVRIGGHSYRSYVRPFTAGQQHATLVVLQSLHRQNEFLDTLAGTFEIVIPLSLILAGMGGYLLARRSLLPVVAMSTQASRIGAENLHQRLDIKNPRDELGRLATSFNELLDRLSRSFERQRRFVADASHELRTPVAILCGETDVTLSKPDRTEEEYRESLRVVGEEARRLKHIVEDLFTLAHADAGQYPLESTDFYLDELASECCRSVRTLASAKQITVGCETQGELPIHADETLVRRMLLNLLDNAIKYTARGGSMCVRCAGGNGQYSLSVEDSGPGIPPDLQPRIFERFFRADKARSRAESDGGGAGLGLAIASWIAQIHGGKLELTHSTPEGSLFTVYLPKRHS